MSDAIPTTPGTGPNAPHPNDEDPAAFFGETDPVEDPTLVDAENAPEPASGEATAGQTFVDDEGVHEIAPTAPAAVPEPEPEPEPAPPTPVAEEPKAQAAPAPRAPKARRRAAAASEPSSSAGPRGYIVIREIEMTQPFLDLFAKEIAEGRDPVKVYMVLEPCVEARNPAPVLLGAFKKHVKRLGQPLRLAAIPLSAWKVRTLAVKPRVIEDNIEIED